jgi:capsular exopolysaccharide synthesis family protein
VNQRSDIENANWLHPPAEAEGLRRYVDTIRERIWLVVIAVVVTTLIAMIYVLTASKTYEATSQILATPVAIDDPVIHTLPLVFESSDPTRDIETATQFVNNLNVAQRVKTDLHSPLSPQALLNKISAQPVATSNIIAVTATGDSPEQAQTIANAFAKATVAERTDDLHRAVQAMLPTLETQLRGSGAAVAPALSTEVAQLQTLASTPDPSMRLQTLADLPTSQASPRPLLSIAGGLLAGLVLGIVAAFAAENLDPRLRREAQLRRLYRLPILGRIPKESGRPSAAPLAPRRISGAGVEAYRTLRTALEVSTTQGDASSHVILVTGSSPAEGKSTTAANLASSLALSGRKVILIEADLRRPALGGALGLQPTGGGVSGVLIESVSLNDALTPAPDYGSKLRVLLADHAGGWISDLFSVPAATKMIRDARSQADYVIIDSPPLSEVADAMPLARQADEVLVVVRLGKTRLEKVSQLGEQLHENGIRPVGFAVIGVAKPSRDAYAYYTQARETRSGAPAPDRGPGGRSDRRDSDGRASDRRAAEGVAKASPR